jgi:hypothetical protein
MYMQGGGDGGSSDDDGAGGGGGGGEGGGGGGAGEGDAAEARSKGSSGRSASAGRAAGGGGVQKRKKSAKGRQLHLGSFLTSEQAARCEVFGRGGREGALDPRSQSGLKTRRPGARAAGPRPELPLQMQGMSKTALIRSHTGLSRPAPAGRTTARRCCCGAAPRSSTSRPPRTTTTRSCRWVAGWEVGTAGEEGGEPLWEGRLRVRRGAARVPRLRPDQP